MVKMDIPTFWLCLYRVVTVVSKFFLTIARIIIILCLKQRTIMKCLNQLYGRTYPKYRRAYFSILLKDNYEN